jgi:two-component system chemotaxis sensor kinase CheA
MRQYLDLFVVESREHLTAAYELLTRLDAESGSREALNSLMRHAHSLKGMAASMGCEGIVGIAHAIEDLVTLLLSEPGADAADHVQVLGDGLACIGRLVDSLEEGVEPADPRADRIARELRLLVGRRGALPGPSLPGLAVEADLPVLEVLVTLDQDVAVSAAATAGVIGALGLLGRVRAIRPPRPEDAATGTSAPFRLEIVDRRDVDELLESVRRTPGVCTAQAVELPPAAGRSPIEETSPRRSVRVQPELLDAILDGALDLLLVQRRAEIAGHARRGTPLARHLERSSLLVRSLYRTVRELRLIPLDTIASRLNETARQLSLALDKPLGFRIIGGDTRIDRSLLEGLIPLLLHLLRNAVDHGLEDREDRTRCDKAPVARVTLTAKRRGNRLALAISDDGRGIDAQVVNRTAVERGLVRREIADQLDEARSLMLLTLPGFSTRTSVDTVSGRGVGLDAVRGEVERMGGSLRIEAVPGEGATFHVILPPTAALQRGVLVRCCGELFALPVNAVERARQRPAADSPLPLVRLDEHLGFPPSVDADGRTPPVLVLRGESPRGLVVDEVVGTREILVKPLAGGPIGLTQYTGAALLDDGEIALVVDPTGIRPA